MPGRVLVYGGKGALGSVVVTHFKSIDYWVLSIDLTTNEEANANILVKSSDDWITQDTQVKKDLEEVVGSEKFDGIFCVAGGWAGGNASSPNFVKSADLMWKQSVWSSVIAAGLASKHLKDDGVLQLTGAIPSLGSTPGMMGYGIAKAAIHQLTKSLSASQGSGLPANCHVLTILPMTLDTPMNRKHMPKADFSSWTPLEFVAKLFSSWTSGESRPVSGSLLKLITNDNQTSIEPVLM